MLTVLMTYLGLGAIAGVLAGLLGVGGGLIIVPMVVFCLSSQGTSQESIMHLALGTSMASIMFTSVSSFWAHHKRGAVHWAVVRRIVPGILVGTFLGSCVASRLSTNFLKAFFVVFLYYVAFLPDAHQQEAEAIAWIAWTCRHVRGGQYHRGSVEPRGDRRGDLVGTLYDVVQSGGARSHWHLSCHWLPHSHCRDCRLSFHGMHASGLPEYSLGYVYLPALAGIVCASVLTAPLGVRLAHTLPVTKLKRVFAVLLVAVGTKMLVSLL